MCVSARGLSRVWSGGLGGIDLPPRAIPAKLLSRITPLISKRQSFLFLKWPDIYKSDFSSSEGSREKQSSCQGDTGLPAGSSPRGFWARGCSPARARGGPCRAAASVDSEAVRLQGRTGKVFPGRSSAVYVQALCLLQRFPRKQSHVRDLSCCLSTSRTLEISIRVFSLCLLRSRQELRERPELGSPKEAG